VPGPDEPLPDNPVAIGAEATQIGYPVIVKAAGGGGGRGMRIVRSAAELAGAVAVTREEAGRAFGNPTLYLEKFLEHPRHVEIQVLCDAHGNAVWLGARDCSMQRRHQKVLEEAPPPMIDAAELAAVGARCTEACRQIGYRGAGTFEFLYEDGAFNFIEMNTRVQVEHPVTEMVTGIDIVQEQICVARGEPLGFTQAEITGAGHAVEARINAEDPRSFAPSPGRITVLDLPGGPGIRVDTHLIAGAGVSPHYDSMVAKVIAHGRTRAEALARLRIALDEMRVEGIATNLPLHRALLRDEGFAQGGVDIHHLQRWLENGHVG
jgi:acetyl-CoA carboxylase biotin carboxylase subunit